MVLNSSKYGSSLQNACCPVRNSKDKATEALESKPRVQWTRARKLPATWSRKSPDRGSGHNLAPPGSDLESSFKRTHECRKPVRRATQDNQHFSKTGPETQKTQP